MFLVGASLKVKKPNIAKTFFVRQKSYFDVTHFFFYRFSETGSSDATNCTISSRNCTIPSTNCTIPSRSFQIENFLFFLQVLKAYWKVKKPDFLLMTFAFSMFFFCETVRNKKFVCGYSLAFSRKFFEKVKIKNFWGTIFLC